MVVAVAVVLVAVAVCCVAVVDVVVIVSVVGSLWSSCLPDVALRPGYPERGSPGPRWGPPRFSRSHESLVVSRTALCM